MEKQSIKPEIKEAKGYRGSNTQFSKVSKNAWVECGVDGTPRFDRGEVEIAQTFGVEFPNCEIRVTIGPWRFYDIAGEISEDKSIIFLDIYSPNVPHVKSSYITDLITNAHKVLDSSQ